MMESQANKGNGKVTHMQGSPEHKSTQWNTYMGPHIEVQCTLILLIAPFLCHTLKLETIETNHSVDIENFPKHNHNRRIYLVNSWINKLFYHPSQLYNLL